MDQASKEVFHVDSGAERRPPPSEQEDTDLAPREEPGMTPPATAPEPETLPEEPDINAPEPEKAEERERI